MLLTKEVEVSASSQMINYYEKLGYKIPRYYNKNNNKMMVKRGTTITVKVNDLPQNSGTTVLCECDNCKDIIKTQWAVYNNHNHDGKTYCKKCANTVLHSKENHPNWNPNKTDEERENERKYPEYTEFAKKIMARDNYTCQCCGKKATDVHHLYGYAGFPDFRLDQSKSLALCNICHDSFHAWHMMKYGGKEKGKNTKEQFEEWCGSKDIILQEYQGEIPTTRWAYCITDDEIIKNIPQYSKEHDILNYAIYNCCNKVSYTTKNKIFLWYDEYIKMSDDEIKTYVESIHNNKAKSIKNRRHATKKVICITIGKTFDSLKDASNKMGASENTIGNCCSNRSKSAGKLQDGTRLKWMYYEDFIKLPQEEQNEILARNKDSSNDGSFVIHNDL